MPPRNPGPMHRATPWPSLPNPLQILRTRREARAAMETNQRRLGTPLQAITFALEGLDHVTEREHFLNDWREGNLFDWPEYQPAPPPAPTLTPAGRAVRAAALLSGFMGGLVFLGALNDAAFSPTPGDPITALVTLAWAASVLICARAAWRSAQQRGEG